MTEYNPDEARKVLEGSLESRIIAYADLKCGKGAEVAAELRKGNYRENHEDPIQTLDKVCGKPEIIDAEFESIDGVVEYQPKPSIAKVALKGTVNLINKTCWYYPLVGALPGKYQERFAQRRGDKSLYYTLSNVVAEGIVTGAALGYAAYLNSVFTLGIILGAPLFIVVTVVNGLVRSAGDENKKGMGSILTCLPMYAAIYSIAAAKAIKDGVAEAYSSAYKELEHKPQEAAKLIEKEPLNRIETNVPARIKEQNTYFTEELDAGMNPEEMPAARKYLHKE